LSLFGGIFTAIEAPARQAFYSTIVSPSHLTNAIALNSVSINGSRFIGPAIGGFMIALVGEGWCFLVNAISYVAVLVALFMMRIDAVHTRRKRADFIEQNREGVEYIRGFLPLKAVIFFIATVSFFGVPIMSIVPALVRDRLGGDSILQGYFISAIGAGALTAAFYLAARKNIKGLGRMITLTGILMGICILSLGFIESPVLACIVAYPLGFALIGSAATSNTLLQTIIDDDKRGRVMSFFTMSYFGMAPLGALVWGFFGRATSLSMLLIIAGAICIAVGLVYEYYRPQVRAATGDRIEHSEVVEKIASAIGHGFSNPF